MGRGELRERWRIEASQEILTYFRKVKTAITNDKPSNGIAKKMKKTDVQCVIFVSLFIMKMSEYNTFPIILYF